MKHYFSKTLIIFLLSIVLLPACTTIYMVNEKNKEEVPSSVIRAKFRVDKKPSLRRILPFLSPIPAVNLDNENFSRQENGDYIAKEAQLNVQPNPQSFQINTVLLLDNSLSIGTNLPKLRSAAIELINLKQDNQNYAIAIFSGEDKLNLITDFTNDKNTLTQAINNITELGNNTTNLYGAIYYSLEHLQKKENNTDKDLMASYQVIVFTDGADRANMMGIEQVINKQKETDYEIIPVVVNSPELEIKKIRLLSTLRDFLNRGKFYKASSFDKLSKAFLKMQKDMVDYANSHYYLEYMSPKRGDNENNYEIRIEPRFILWKYMNRMGDKIFNYDNKIKDDFNSKDFYSVKQGICVTANDDFEQSEKIWNENIIYFKRNKEQRIYLFSVGGKNPQAKYEKPVLDNDNFEFKKIDDNIDIYDWLIIIPKGKRGAESTLTIKDIENGFDKTIKLKIK